MDLPKAIEFLKLIFSTDTPAHAAHHLSHGIVVAFVCSLSAQNVQKIPHAYPVPAVGLNSVPRPLRLGNAGYSDQSAEEACKWFRVVVLRTAAKVEGITPSASGLPPFRAELFPGSLQPLGESLDLPMTDIVSICKYAFGVPLPGSSCRACHRWVLLLSSLPPASHVNLHRPSFQFLFEDMCV